jgi:hypothetical protein
MWGCFVSQRKSVSNKKILTIFVITDCIPALIIPSPDGSGFIFHHEVQCGLKICFCEI